MEADTRTGRDIQRLIEPLCRGKFWMQLVGVMLILGGLFTALSIVGIVIAWIPIWAGIALMQAAGSIDQAYTTGDDVAAELAMRRLKTYFTIFGVLTLVYIVIAVLGVMLGVGAGMMGGGHGMGMEAY
ncbi:MAG: DUF5362 family protein [Halofilum sp. (in: g-proteobacteria)]